jgi:hypothetical protein
MKKTILTTILIFAILTANTQTTYFVSLTGNDSNSGTENLPFRTITQGVSVLISGDTLVIKSGDYGNEHDIVIPNSGTQTDPITIMAEPSANVILRGTRNSNEINGGGYGFKIYRKSFIIVDGIKFTDYAVGISLDGYDSASDFKNGNISIRNCIFENNGSSGISIWKIDTMLVENCQFITSVPENGFPESYPNAIQDYGTSIYFSDNIRIESNHYFGPHNQALSFKEGCTNGIAKNNIIEGALYCAIYLGQNKRSNGRIQCTNLTADTNIIRRAIGEYNYVKSPIRIDNVENATVKGNYIESFDYTNNTSGINIFNEVLGTINVHDNIIAFAVNNPHSGGIVVQWGIPATTSIDISYNTIYDVKQDWFGILEATQQFHNNISFQCDYNGIKPNNFYGDPTFINGHPIKQTEMTNPTIHDFNNYYEQLINPFKLASGDTGFGYRFDYSIVNVISVENDELKIYPNPASNFIIINTSKTVKKINIYNQIGKKIYTKENITENTIDTSNLKNGIYFLIVQMDKTIVKRKLVINQN